MSKEEKRCIKLLKEVNAMIEKRGITKISFARELNNFLPLSERRTLDQSRLVVVYRWLSVNIPKWSCPNAETILAIQAWLKYNNRTFSE